MRQVASKNENGICDVCKKLKEEEFKHITVIRKDKTYSNSCGNTNQNASTSSNEKNEKLEGRAVEFSVIMIMRTVVITKVSL